MGGVPVVVTLSVLLALAVAIATRIAPESAASAAAVQAQTASPQALAMGGAVPAAQPSAAPTWSVRNRQLRVSYLDTVTFVDDREGFVAGGGNLLVTHDGGVSWAAAQIPDVGGSIASIACPSPADCVAGGWTASDAVQLLTSRDGGSSWQPARLPSGRRDLTHLACSNASRCVAVGQGIGQSPWELQSDDGGKTWQAAQPPPALKSLSVLECSADGSCLAAGGSQSPRSFRPYGYAVIDRSIDGGRSWTQASVPQVQATCSTSSGGAVTCNGPVGPVPRGSFTPLWPPTTISCPTPTVCLEENIGPRELSSHDGGATWQLAPTSTKGCPPGQTFCSAYLPVATEFVTPTLGWRSAYDECGGFNFATESYQSCAADIEKTTDGGRTWTPTVNTDYVPSISCPDATHCWAVETTNSSGSVMSTSDGGAHWSLTSLTGGGLLNNLTCASASVCFASGSDPSGNPAVLRSSDAGRSWAAAAIPQPASKPSSPPFVGPRASYIDGLACTTTTTCLAAATDAMYATRDGGVTWSPVAAPTAPGTAVTVFGVTCADTAACVVATTNGLFRSTDLGTTWGSVGPHSSGSLFVTCAPGGRCIADDLGVTARNRTGLLESADAGQTWKAASISLPAGLSGIAFSANSETPGQVYYLSCWDRKHCDAMGLGRTNSGAQRWYLLRTGDGAATWSASTLPADVEYVGSLGCSTSGDCLVAGANNDGAALWSLHGSHLGALAGPSWSRFGRLTSIVCPAQGHCLGTANANDATFVFDVAIPSGASAAWSDSLPTPGAAFSNIGVDLKSAAVATGATLFITFPSQLFNLTFQENYAEIVAWGRRMRERLGRRGRRTSRSQVVPEPSSANRSSPLMIALLVILTGALLGALLNPRIAFDRATLEGYVGVGVALLVSMGCIALSLVGYRARRGLRHPLRLHALPLGLVVAAGCVIVSRLLNFEPGYLYGVVCGVALGKQLREHEEAHIAALSTAATLVLAAASWAAWVPLHAAVQPGGGFFGHVLDNALVALVMSGLVNTVIVLLPLRFMAGWTLIRWRRDAWAAMFALALFTLVAVLARTPASPGPHSSPVVVTIALFVLFGGGSVAFREYFSRKWRRAHGIEIHGLRAHIRELLSVRPNEEVEVLSAPGSAQVVMEEDDPS
ncbi:MAG: hypothetical protein QOC82_2984 [Frankiaceae bacterium]|nr:hypothetical protein [Frankiaceae bacterium]